MKNVRGRMKKAQRKRISAAVLAAATWTTIVVAQDTKSAPSSQQIPPPTCLTLKGAWEGGYTPCTDATHQQWLADISHWRTERRIRIGYDDARYKMPVEDFHRRGVRVLFPMMMWDQGTREPGKSWPDAIAEVMKEVDADGVNGDTQDGVPLAFSLAADRVGQPL